ncbi:hypothetical protein ES705_18299 [subsurface metagenome]
MTKELNDFLLQQCKDKGLSLRSLSINCGLSPATVHSIISRNYKPSLISLNRLADYLGVRREYLWQLVGLLEDMDYAETTFGDPRLRFQFARVDNLPEAERNLIIGIVEAVLSVLKSMARGSDSDTSFAEYVRRKYPGVHEDTITMMEDLLEHPPATKRELPRKK